MDKIPHIFIDENTLAIVNKQVTKASQTEIGGILMGKVCEHSTGRSIFISKASGPGKNAVLTPNSFCPDIKYYQSFVLKNSDKSYIGEWHTHPQKYDSWSEHDLEQARKILWDENKTEIICLICLPHHTNKGRFKFYYLNRELTKFIPLSYTVVPNQKIMPKNIRNVYFQSSLLVKFLSSKQNSRIVNADFYQNDKIIHVFEQPYLKNQKVLLIRDSQQIEIADNIDVVAVISKKNKQLIIRCYQVKEQITELKTEIISLRKDIFARNRNLLETNILQNCHVTVIGLGSIGSVGAAELARAGVGKFTLIDNDVLSVNNICRHLCDLSEIGIPKVTAVQRRLQKIFPAIKVQTHIMDINKNPEKALSLCSKTDLILISTDTENSRKLANWIALQQKVPIIFAGVLERAIGGRVWRVVPQQTCCYECHSETLEIKMKGTVPYSEANSIRDLKIQPGLGNDIAFISHIAVRFVMETLKCKKIPTEVDLPFHLVFWFNHTDSNWKTQGLSIYHLEDLPVNENCSICQSLGENNHD